MISAIGWSITAAISVRRGQSPTVRNAACRIYAQRMALTEEVRLRELWKYLWFFRIMSLKKGAVGKRIILPLHIFGRLLAGVHFECRFTAGMVVSKVEWRNLSLCARWTQSFFASPACKKGAVAELRFQDSPISS